MWFKIFMIILYLQMNMAPLYACDRGNSCIHVLSNGGEYLHSFGCDGSCVSKLSGIYVTSQYIYVTNWGNQYTTEGEHVTSFGQYGT